MADNVIALPTPVFDVVTGDTPTVEPVGRFVVLTHDGAELWLNYSHAAALAAALVTAADTAGKTAARADGSVTE